MPTVSGQLFFDRTRTATAAGTGMTGIANVPIVLQSLTSGAMLAVLTGATGNFSFTNVTNGDYQLVEAYGTPATLVGTGDFSNAVLSPMLVGGVVPPISYVTSPPSGATNLDCTIRNTRLITVAGANLTAQNFLNGPVKYTPLSIDNSNISTINQATSFDFGTFGSFSPGTVANTGAYPHPYPDIGSQFTFVQPNPAVVTPSDGQYTIQNLMNNSHSNTAGTWWIIADHTTGNETGRMMVINGSNPGAIILSRTNTITVKPNSLYLFSCWILNLCKLAGYAQPALGVTVYGQQGEILYDKTLGTEIPRSPNYPEWKQAGAIFNTGNNTLLTLQFKSMGPAATGNDYALDDIGFYEVYIPPEITVTKTSDRTHTLIDGTITFCSAVRNDGNVDIYNSIFRDVLDAKTTYVDGTFTVDGITQTPTFVGSEIQYQIPLLAINQTISICFQVQVKTG